MVDQTVLKAYILNSKKSSYLESRKKALTSELKDVDDELGKVQKFIKFIETENSTIKKQAGNFNKIEYTWREKLAALLHGRKTPMTHGDIVEAIIFCKLDDGLSKADVQRRVNTQLYAMVNEGSLVKTKNDIGNLYVLKA